MPRTVTILYFAAVREILGTSEARLVLEDDVVTIADLSTRLERAHPVLAGRLASVRFAVNETFVSPDARIANEDVIAVIPPVSGG